MALMRRVAAIGLLGIMFFSITAPAQEWVRMMEDPDANFYDIQREFNAYWEGKTVEKGRGWKQFKRWEYFMEPRVFPSGKLPAPDQSAQAFRAYMRSYRAGAAAQQTDYSDWTPLGPSSWQNSGSGYNPGIGRINCSAVDPFDSNIIYVGAPSGGLWNSTDGGSSWQTPTDQLTVLGVTSVAIDPSNPATIYIATGDGDAGDTYSIGVLKSTDGGATWNETGLNWEITQTRRISKLLIHPDNSDILLAATSNGIYRSTNAGQNWSNSRSGNFKDIEFKPNDASIVYAAGTSFLRSADNGISFSSVSGTPSSGAVNRLAIAVTPANPEYVYLLAGRNSDSGFYGLYHSANSGLNFSQRSNSPNILGYAPDGSSSGGQSWYDLALAASPTNPDEIFSGGVNIWRSTDGGFNWNINTYWIYTDPAYPYVHADIHTLDFHGDRLFAGADGGIFYTDDRGATWTDISAGMATMQFYRFGGYPGDAGLLIGGAQDNGTNRYNSGQWYHVLGADGMEAAIDYSDPNIMYCCIQNGGLRRSFDGGNSWGDITGGISGNGAWVTPYVIDPHHPQILYAGYSNLWKSTNRGSSWSQISNVFSGINALAVAPSDPSYIYASSGATIQRTTDGGTNWENISGGLSGSAITYIAVADNDPEKVWVTYSGYSDGNKIYRTADGGANWENYSANLPNLPVNCVAYQRGGIDALYVGTDVGIYYRNNTMSEWMPFITNLPNVIVQELEIHYGSDRLRAATYGRGIWESPLAPSTAAIAHAPLNDTEDTVGPYPLTVTITPGTAGLVGDSVLIKFGTGSFSQTAPLLPFGNPNEYRGVIAGQGSGVSIQYYISTADSLGFHVNLPANAPADYFSFYAGPDTVAPLLVHSSVPFVDIAELPLSIQAGASDNLGVDSVWVEYTINDQSQAPFGMQRSGDEFSATFPFDSSDVAIDDSVSYRILARDVSAAMNQTVSGPHVFDIRKVLSTIQVVNKGIPDNDPSGISDTLHISEPGYSLKDLEIYLDAIHTHTGDLVVQLTAPNGTMLTLVDRPGYPATPTGSPGIHPKITLDDQAETSIEDIAFSAGQQVLGTFRPDPDLLANVNGFAYSGDWIITVSDHNAGSPGLLRNWGMIASLSLLTGIADVTENDLPRRYRLEANYPNPFNPATVISYQLSVVSDVKLTIYNLLGEKVATLVDARQNAGRHQVRWDGRDRSGRPVSSGVYIYRLKAGEFQQSRKMILLR